MGQSKDEAWDDESLDEETAVSLFLPPIADIFFPPFHKGGQPKDAAFMAMRLEGRAAGVSFILLADGKMEAYNGLQPPDFIGKPPVAVASEFGSDDPIKEMIDR